MTDQHPLTDETCERISSRCVSTTTSVERNNMRAAADWQLEQVLNWCSKYIHTKSVDALREAMRPTTQEDLEDVQLVLERTNSIPEPITLEELMTLDDTTQEDN